MKSAVLLLITLWLSLASWSQTDTSFIEQYCEVIAQGRLLSNKVTIDVNFGEERKFFGGDTRLRDEISGRVKKFNSVVDALNYLGQQGWILVNAFPNGEPSGSRIYHFYFKKSFRKDVVLKDGISYIPAR